MLPEEVQERLELRIHGENKHFRGGDFDRKVTALLERTSEVVRPMGAYRNRDVVSLMRDCDWIVVPSIWWENSPIVIQEARMAGRPLLCSNIGGMAEKATPGVDRLFSAGSPGSLAQRLTEIVTGAVVAVPLALAERSQGIARTDDGVFAAHLAVYRGAGAALGVDRRLAS